MAEMFQRRFLGLGLIVVVAGAALASVLALSGAARAGARTPRAIHDHAATPMAPLLSLGAGDFEISLGTPPLTLPLSGRPQTLTLFGGPARARPARTQNAYVAFIAASATCARTPATGRTSYVTFSHFYATAHSASRHAGVFAPDGGAAQHTFLATRNQVVVHQHGETRACIWVATNPGPSHTVRRGGHKHVIAAPASLVASPAIVLENDTFAAAVSNLAGATAGTGGYELDAIDGAHAFHYRAATTQCSTTTHDPGTRIGADIPASDTVGIPAAPCAGDASTFTFSGPDVHRSLSYPVTDALAAPPLTVGLGGCELDPVTGTDLASAQAYLQAIGCHLGRVQISPYVSSLPRGAVAWASLDGGVAELAPAGASVDLVLNGTPLTAPATPTSTATTATSTVTTATSTATAGTTARSR